MQAFVDALRLLRKTLAALKPPVPVMPDGSVYKVGHDEPAVVKACCDILEAIADTQENKFFRISAIRIQAELQGVHLLPVPWEFLRKIDDLIGAAGGKERQPSGATGRKRKRASDKPRKARPLTMTQTETLQIVGECKGNIAAAAVRLGKDRKTVEESYRKGLDKLGKEAYKSKDKTRLLTRDKRGQALVSNDDDKRF